MEELVIMEGEEAVGMVAGEFDIALDVDVGCFRVLAKVFAL